MGILLRRRVPGLVAENPRCLCLARTGFKIRSMVEAEILRSLFLISSDTFCKKGNQVGRIATRRLEQGRLAVSQIFLSGSIM